MCKCATLHHSAGNLRKLVMPSSLKLCDSNDSKVAFHADKMKIKMIETSTSKKTSKILDKEEVIVDRMRKLSAQLRDSGV